MRAEREFTAADQFLDFLVDQGEAEDLTVQVIGAMTGSIEVRGSADGVTFVALLVRDATAGTTAAEITSAGIYELVHSLAGFEVVRVYAAALSSGTPTVVARTARAAVS